MLYGQLVCSTVRMSALLRVKGSRDSKFCSSEVNQTSALDQFVMHSNWVFVGCNTGNYMKADLTPLPYSAWLLLSFSPFPA